MGQSRKSRHWRDLLVFGQLEMLPNRAEQGA